MAELRQNTWETDTWYDQAVAGNVSYQWGGSLWAWGNNANGVLGQNTSGGPTKVSSPVQIPTDRWKSFSPSSNSNRVVAIKANGTMWCWGRNEGGALGLNEVDINYSSPIQIGTDSDWSLLSHMGGEATYGAIKTDGTLWMWGASGQGKLGTGDEVNRSSPHQIPGEYDVIACGRTNSCAIKSDGTLWSWGNAVYGGLGLNDTVKRSSPTQVGTNTNWKHCASGTYNQMAVNTSGQLFTWGQGNNGMLGLNNTNQYSSPTSVPGTWAWASMSMTNAQNMIGVKTNGQLFTWGSSSYGALGHNQGPGNNYSSPKQISGTWSTDPDLNGQSPLSNDNSMGAMKADGTWWVWGMNTYGQLGLNETWPAPSGTTPVQLPGSWNIVKQSAYGGQGIKPPA